MRRGWKTAGTQRCLGRRNPLWVISLLPWNLHGGLLPCLQNHASLHLQWGKKVFSQPPIVQILPLKKIREACNFHHRYTSTMRDKIRKKNSRKSHCRIFKEFICKLWWKISIWSITKFHLNTLLYTLCCHDRGQTFSVSLHKVFTHCCWYFGPFLHADLL